MATTPDVIDTMPSLVGDNPVQPTLAKQPRIAGDFGKMLQFDGVSCVIPVDLSAITSEDQLTVYTVSVPTSAATGIIVEATALYYTTNGVSHFMGGTPYAGHGAPINYRQLLLSAENIPTSLASTHDRTGILGNEIVAYLDAEEQTVFTSSGDADTAGNFAVGTGSWIGARDNGASSPFNGYIAFVGVRSGIDSAETISRTNAQLAKHWRTH